MMGHSNPTVNLHKHCRRESNTNFSPFPQLYIPAGLLHPWFLPFLSWYVPGEACNPSDFSPLLILWYLPGETSYWHLRIFAEASLNIITQIHRIQIHRPSTPGPRSEKRLHSWSLPLQDRSRLCSEFRGCPFLSTEWTLLQHGVPRGEARPGRGHVPRLPTRRRALNAPLRNTSVIDSVTSPCWLCWKQLRIWFCACTGSRHTAPKPPYDAPNPEKGRC